MKIVKWKNSSKGHKRTIREVVSDIVNQALERHLRNLNRMRDEDSDCGLVTSTRKGKRDAD
jgi:hypothetical protein